MKIRFSKKLLEIDQTNYITVGMVKKALSTIEGQLKIDGCIIGYFNRRDMDIALKSFQKKYEMGTPLEKLSIKIADYLNWRVFEFFPVEESLNKYQFLKNYTRVHFNENPEYETIINELERKINSFEKSNKNGS